MDEYYWAKDKIFWVKELFVQMHMTQNYGDPVIFNMQISPAFTVIENEYNFKKRKESLLIWLTDFYIQNEDEGVIKISRKCGVLNGNG